MTDDRPSDDETWIEVAKVIAKKSKCSRRQIGSVIVTPSQRIVASGYNGPPAGLPVTGPCSGWCPRAKDPDNAGVGYDDCYTVHAEMNAIAYVDRTSIEGGTLYSTSAVCYGCSKVVANCGVLRVVHIVTEADAHRQPKMAEEFMRWSGLKVERWEG